MKKLIAQIFYSPSNLSSVPKRDIYCGYITRNAAAIEGQAGYIVTGDKHVLNLQKFKTMKIISPKTFVDILKKIT